MTSKSPEVRAREVQHMFNRIAPRYDLMNWLMTFGMDVRLRKIVIRKTTLPIERIIAGSGFRNR